MTTIFWHTNRGISGLLAQLRFKRENTRCYPARFVAFEEAPTGWGGPMYFRPSGGLTAASIRLSSSDNASACSHGARSQTFGAHYSRPSYPPSSRRPASRSNGVVPSPPRRSGYQDARTQARYAKRCPALLARSRSKEPPLANGCFGQTPVNHLLLIRATRPHIRRSVRRPAEIVGKLPVLPVTLPSP